MDEQDNKNLETKNDEIDLEQVSDKIAGGSMPSVKRKEDTHRMAEANKAFAHYRFEIARDSR